MLFQKISLEKKFLFTWREDQLPGNPFFSWKTLALFCFITKVRNFTGRFNFFIHLMRKQSIWHREEDINYMQEIIQWINILSILLKAHNCWLFTIWIQGVLNHLNIVAIFFGFSFCFLFVGVRPLLFCCRYSVKIKYSVCFLLPQPPVFWVNALSCINFLVFTSDNFTHWMEGAKKI